jgi:hypothetical protein
MPGPELENISTMSLGPSAVLGDRIESSKTKTTFLIFFVKKPIIALESRTASRNERHRLREGWKGKEH